MLYFFDAVISSLLTQNLVVNTFCKLLGEYIHITNYYYYCYYDTDVYQISYQPYTG